VRCPRCGNENPGDNRFCGMCGASLLSNAAAGPSVTEAGAAAAPAHEPQRSTTAVSQTPPSISGPSFLGLGDPGPSRGARKRASLSIDPHSAPGSNLDYLLEDQPHHWGIGKILVILIALGLAAGFGYLRFKDEGLALLNGLKKPAAAITQNSSAPETTSTPASSPSITPESQSPPPPVSTTPQPAPSNPSDAPGGNVAAPPAPATPGPVSPPPTDAVKSTDTTPPANSDKKAASDKPAPDSDSAATPDNDSAAKDTETESSAAPSKAADKPKRAPKAPAPKPTAATRPAGYDPVTEARKYIYGRGAPHDCDRGMRLLKPEANRSNPKAMVELGALYSAGLCTPRDLPTAYRWFALALRKNPENTSVQGDLSKLWGEMTQPERQLAIKLTQ